MIEPDNNLIQTCTVCGNHPTCQDANQYYDGVRSALFDPGESKRGLEDTLKRIKELRNIEALSHQAVKFGIDIFRRIMK